MLSNPFKPLAQENWVGCSSSVLVAWPAVACEGRNCGPDLQHSLRTAVLRLNPGVSGC